MANRLVKKYIQTCKRILNKSMISWQDLYIGILEYQNTPMGGMVAQDKLLMRRQLQSVLPVTQKHLEKNCAKSKLSDTNREI